MIKAEKKRIRIHVTNTQYSTLHVKAKLLHLKSCTTSFSVQFLKGLFPSDTAPVALCGKL